MVDGVKDPALVIYVDVETIINAFNVAATAGNAPPEGTPHAGAGMVAVSGDGGVGFDSAGDLYGRF